MRRGVWARASELTNWQDDDEAPGPLQKIRASICEIAELYAQKYLDAFPQLGSFVNGVWNMLTTVGAGTREDVVSSADRVRNSLMRFVRSWCPEPCAFCPLW